MFKNILVGVDGSEQSFRAVAVAGELVRCTGAAVRLVACFEPIPAFLGEPNLQATIRAHMSDAEEAMRAAMELLGDTPGELKTELLEGSPAEVILSVAEARDIDLIVMGTHGRGRLGGMLMGSQSQKVVAHAHCPVMLVR